MSQTKIIVNRHQDQPGWIVVERVARGHYRTVAHSLTETSDCGCSATWLAFCQWDHEVENLDAFSDAVCFNASEHLRWNEVDLTPEEFCVTSIRRLRKALQHIVF